MTVCQARILLPSSCRRPECCFEDGNRAASAPIMLEMLRAIEGGRPMPISEVSVWRILTRESNRGAKSALWVRRGLDPKTAWVELTADWTAPLEYEAPVREYLEKLKALGYTQ